MEDKIHIFESQELTLPFEGKPISTSDQTVRRDMYVLEYGFCSKTCP